MSQRIEKVNQLIKKELAKIILPEIDFPKDILVTLTRVETSRDLRESKVWISVWPERDCQKILAILHRHISILQQKLNKRLKMRSVPKIKFLEEKKTKEADRIERILESLKKKKNRLK